MVNSPNYSIRYRPLRAELLRHLLAVLVKNENFNGNSRNIAISIDGGQVKPTNREPALLDDQFDRRGCSALETPIAETTSSAVSRIGELQ
jgi:hypothetical protein